jgi:hypothetical protein
MGVQAQSERKKEPRLAGIKGDPFLGDASSADYQFLAQVLNVELYCI